MPINAPATELTVNSTLSGSSEFTVVQLYLVFLLEKKQQEPL